MSHCTKRVGVPSPVSSLASASPRSADRPASTSPVAPRSTSLRATASPSPCVPPLMIVTVMDTPCRSSAWSDQPLGLLAGLHALVGVDNGLAAADLRHTDLPEGAALGP